MLRRRSFSPMTQLSIVTNVIVHSGFKLSREHSSLSSQCFELFQYSNMGIFRYEERYCVDKAANSIDIQSMGSTDMFAHSRSHYITKRHELGKWSTSGYSLQSGMSIPFIAAFINCSNHVHSRLIHFCRLVGVPLGSN